MSEQTFPFLRVNDRQVKPRTRGPYYAPMGKRYLEDVLETMGEYIDSLKFASGSFTLIPRRVLTELVELCHKHDVLVSTGGFIESVLGGVMRDTSEKQAHARIAYASGKERAH